MDAGGESGPGERIGPPRPAARDWLVAGALALAAGLLYALTFQTRWFGDGPGLANLHLSGGGSNYYHLLYLPACDLLERVLGAEDPFLAPRLLSILPAALAVGLVYMVARATDAPAHGALAATALLALAPSLWFFGTTVEVHALHVLCVALVALVTLLAPWSRPALALALTALAFPLLYWSHQAAFTLGPGWVLLVRFARGRHGARYGWKGLVLGVGPALLAALLAGVLVSYLVRLGSLGAVLADVRGQLALQGGQANLASQRVVWRDEWLLPLGVLVPLGMLGLAALRRERMLVAALATLLLVPAAFFLWWGVFEMGGYFLGSSVFLAVAVAHLLGRATPARAAVALALLAAQAGLGWSYLRAYDTGFDPARRAALVREALGDSGLLLTGLEAAPSLQRELPGVKEVSIPVLMRNACQRERRLLPPDALLETLRKALDPRLRRNPRVALEIGHRNRPPDEGIRAFRLGLEALEQDLRERYVVREIDDPYWPLLVLEQPR